MSDTKGDEAALSMGELQELPPSSPTRFGTKEEKERVIIFSSPNKGGRKKTWSSTASTANAGLNTNSQHRPIHRQAELDTSSHHHPIHRQMVMSKLKPLKADIMNYLESQGGASISELSFSVNDAAGGKPFNECYEKEDILGEGGFAVVYRCHHYERQHKYAVKEILKEQYECAGENLKEEIDSLKRLREVPYIVRLMDVFYEPDVCYVVMELMRGGDLLDRLCEVEVYEEAEARKASRRLLEAVYFCHKKHIVHRDIKPENILLASKESNTAIKLADFGCARRFEPGTSNLFTLCGSKQYVAPELYTHQNGYDERCDLWSAGIVIYVILGGYAPFDADDHDLPKIICEGHYEFHDKYWANISEAAKNLIRSLLQVDPRQRPTLAAALDSEWLRRRDKDLIKKNQGSTNSCDASFEKSQSSHSFQSSFRSLDSSMHSGIDCIVPEGEEGGSEGSLQTDDLL